MKNIIYSLLFIFPFHAALNAQTQDSSFTRTVEVMAINKAFSCPVLTPRLIRSLGKKYSAQNPTVSDDKMLLTFSVPDSIPVNADTIVKMAMSAGFPPDYIRVKIDAANKKQ
jgi:hypothetical protein